VRTLLKLNRKWSETGSGRTEGQKDLRRVPRFPPQFSPLSLRFSVRDFVLDYPLSVFISPTCGKIISAQKSTSGSFLYSCHTFRFRVFRLFYFSLHPFFVSGKLKDLQVTMRVKPGPGTHI